MLVIGVLAWGAYWGYDKLFSKSVDQTFVSTDYEVITGDVANTINLAGSTNFANAQKLTFAVDKWRVTSVNVKVGDAVKKGQILATVSSETADQELEKMRNILKKVQRELEKKLKNSNRELDLLTAEVKYQQLLLEQSYLPQSLNLSWEQDKLELKTLEYQLKTLEKELENLEKDYSLLSGSWDSNKITWVFLEKDLDDRKENLQNLVNAFYLNAYEVQERIDSYDEILLITDKYADSLSQAGDSAKDTIYIGAKDQSSLNKAKDQFFVVRSYIDRLQKLYDTRSVIPIEKIKIQDLLSDYQVFLQLGAAFQEWGRLNHTMFLASIETSTLPIQKIQNYVKSYGIEYQTLSNKYKADYYKAAKLLSQLDDPQETVEKFEKKIEEKKIAIAKQKMLIEQKKLNLTQISMNDRLTELQKKKEIADAKEKWEELRDDMSESDDLINAREAVDQAQSDVAAALKKYEDYKIIANFDGVVTKVNMQVGDSISAPVWSSNEDAKYIYVETPDLLEVKLEVDQIDIVKIKLGMKVQVFVDALPDAEFEGYFSEIDTLSDGNTYKAKVVFKKQDPEQKILGGMSANIRVILWEEKNAIIAPNAAIADNDQGEKIVRLQKDGGWIDQVVEIWLSDDANTVVLSGLKVGDVIKGLYINETSLQNMGVGPQDEEDLESWMGAE